MPNGAPVCAWYNGEPFDAVVLRYSRTHGKYEVKFGDGARCFMPVDTVTAKELRGVTPSSETIPSDLGAGAGGEKENAAPKERNADAKNTAPGVNPESINGVSTVDEDRYMASLLTGLAAAPLVNNPLASTTLAHVSVARDTEVDTKVKAKVKKVEEPKKQPMGRKRTENVERNKVGRIIRTCGINSCEYRTGHLQHMKKHKAAKHGINVTWFSCDQPGCEYRAKQATHLKQHKQHIHNIGVVWHYCNICDYRAKENSNLKTHKRMVHNIDVVWHHCDRDGCDYKAKQGGNLKRHVRNVHEGANKKP